MNLIQALIAKNIRDDRDISFSTKAKDYHLLKNGLWEVRAKGRRAVESEARIIERVGCEYFDGTLYSGPSGHREDSVTIRPLTKREQRIAKA